MSEEELVPVKAKTPLFKPMTNVDFANLQLRGLLSSTKYTSNQNEDLSQFSFGPNRHYKQTVVKNQDNYDVCFTSNDKLLSTSSYNFKSKCFIAAN